MASDTPGFYGREKHIINLADYYKDVKDMDIMFLVARKNSFSLALENLEYDVKVINYFDVFSVLRFLRREKIDIVHAHDFKSSLLLRCLKPFVRYKLVTTVHNHILDAKISAIKKMFYRFLDIMTHRFVNHFIVVSDALRVELLGEGVSAKKIDYVLNGVPLPVSICAFQDQDGLRKIAVLGRIHYIKGQEKLIRALAKLKKDAGVKFELSIYGTGEIEADLKKLTIDLGLENNVSFMGYSDKIDRVYKKHDYIVLPSMQNEGTPLVLLEAMGWGKIVIASKVGGMPEVVADGENGFLCEPGDIDGLSAALLKAFNLSFENKNAMANKARKTIEGKYDKQSMAKATKNIYDKL